MFGIFIAGLNCQAGYTTGNLLVNPTLQECETAVPG